MKTCLTIAISLAFATAAVRGQDLPTYQSTVTGQSPYYYNNLDNSLTPSIGTGTLVPTATGTGFDSDYYGNANDAAFFTNTTAQLSLAAGNNIIDNSGTSANAIGSLSMLFYTPNTNGNAPTTTRYIFSDGDSSPNEFYLKMLGTNTLIIAAGNKSITNSTTLQDGQWYYFAATWNFTGANSSTYGINYYLGAAGQPTNTLVSGFTQRGGTGNISSTALLGNGGAFELSGTQAGSGGFQVNGVPGMADELATWNTQLTLSQIDSQFNALILVPEPSSLALCGSALVGLCVVMRRRRAFKK